MAAIQRRKLPEQMTRTPQRAAERGGAVQIRPMGLLRLVHGSGFLAASVSRCDSLPRSCIERADYESGWTAAILTSRPTAGKGRGSAVTEREYTLDVPGTR
jgi:hypothetical protein